ncbi:MLP-like protein 43 [Silene latifolia]|uniref:MLP-like protein 43 n=1 Tax=Silene latifolia TaxID=37657 RepID=UPI003D7835F3
MVKRKLEGEVEIRESAKDVFHDFYQNRPHDIPVVNPDFVQACDLHEGAYGTPGSIIEWKYSIDGKPQTMKELVEVVDEENKIMKFKCLEGDLMKYYNYFDITLQVFPKDNENSIARWTFEYEKKQDNDPDPTAEMDELIKLAKQIDDHHHHHTQNT